MNLGSLFSVIFSLASLPGLNIGGLCFSCKSCLQDRQLQQNRAKGAASGLTQPVAPKVGVVLSSRLLSS